MLQTSSNIKYAINSHSQVTISLGNQSLFLPIVITYRSVHFFTKLRTARFSKYNLKYKDHTFVLKLFIHAMHAKIQQRTNRVSITSAWKLYRHCIQFILSIHKTDLHREVTGRTLTIGKVERFWWDIQQVSADQTYNSQHHTNTSTVT